MSVDFHSENLNFRLKKIRVHKRWIERVIKSQGNTSGNISIIFTTNSFLLKLNREYLNHNYFTDVITFDYSEKELISGDVYISIDQVRINAMEYGTEIYEELRRVMIHGVLHLLGFMDGTKEEKATMRSREDEALKFWRKD